MSIFEVIIPNPPECLVPFRHLPKQQAVSMLRNHSTYLSYFESSTSSGGSVSLIYSSQWTYECLEAYSCKQPSENGKPKYPFIRIRLYLSSWVQFPLTCFDILDAEDAVDAVVAPYDGRPRGPIIPCSRSRKPLLGGNHRICRLFHRDQIRILDLPCRLHSLKWHPWVVGVSVHFPSASGCFLRIVMTKFSLSLHLLCYKYPVLSTHVENIPFYIPLCSLPLVGDLTTVVKVLADSPLKPH